MYNSPVEEIKDRIDIVEVVGDYLDLKKVGKGYQAPCPFHKEKNPSFHVSPDLQIFKCFGCGVSGDVFTFIQKIEGVGFRDALRMLADRAGVELKSEDKELRSKRQKLERILELATRFFEKQLEESSAGKKAFQYLKKRNISEQSIEKWRLGYAPDSWDGLKDFLTDKGFPVKDILEAGLLVQKEESGSVYDRFRGRIMFPIFNLQGVVVGFGGRVLGKADTAKYINTPQTLLYNKSRVLYGINRAKLPIRDKEKVILVEGYTDVIMSHQAGFQNTVAVSGTALTPYQLKILNRYCDQLLTAFDMDSAGQEATKKSIKLAQKKEFLVRVIEMPEDKDPADIISDDPHQWEESINNAETVFDFYFDWAFSHYSADKPEGRKKISQELLPIIASVEDKIEQSRWVQELAQRLEVDESSIREELSKQQQPGSSAEPAVEIESSLDQNNLTRRELLERRILALILTEEELLDEIPEEVEDNFSERVQKILELFSEGQLEKQRKKNRDLDLWLREKALDLKQEEVDVEEDLQSCLAEFQKIILKEQLRANHRCIQKAEQNEQEDILENLLKQNKEINQKICQLNKKQNG